MNTPALHSTFVALPSKNTATADTSSAMMVCQPARAGTVEDLWDAVKAFFTGRSSTAVSVVVDTPIITPAAVTPPPPAPSGVTARPKPAAHHHPRRRPRANPPPAPPSTTAADVQRLIDTQAARDWLSMIVRSSAITGRAYSGSETAASLLADTMSPSVARGIKTLDTTGTLNAVISASLHESGIPDRPDRPLPRIVFAAIRRYELRAYLPKET